jgi:hypothetical protein
VVELMALYPCSTCGQRKNGKQASLYWAWYLADGNRKAVRQRECVDCYAEWFLPLWKASYSDPADCPLCHTESLAEMDACYVKVFVPGSPEQEIAFPTCGPCAVELRNRALEGSIDLPNREGELRGLGPSTKTSGLEVWNSLGLDPDAWSRGA